MRIIFLCYLLLFLVALFPVSAQYNGTLNNNTANVSGIYTGLFAATHSPYCNATASCVSGDKCIFDFDGTSSGLYSGWCVASSETRCIANDTYYSSGTYPFCSDSTTRRYCNAGTWETSGCSSGQTCSGGNCSTSSSSSTSSTSSNSNITSNTTAKNYKTASLKIVSSISTEIVQGQTGTKLLEVKNDGELTLYNITPSLTGIENWSTISPTKVGILTVNMTTTFIFSFSVPSTAAVKLYEGTISLATNNASIKPVASFTLKVLPSNTTIETEINPAFATYLELVQELERNITDLHNKGANTTDLENALASIKNQFNEINASLAAKDYFRANQLLASVGASIDALKSNIATTQIPKPPDYLFIGIVAVVILAVIGGLAYILWPTKEAAGYTEKGWSPPEKKESILDKLKNKFKKKEKQQKEFKYEYKGRR